MRLIRVRDLKCYTGTSAPRPMLLCVECGGQYSADAGDYFMARLDTILKCCDEPMRLVHKSTQYVEVTA
jgi:hypothetical protein